MSTAFLKSTGTQQQFIDGIKAINMGKYLLDAEDNLVTASHDAATKAIENLTISFPEYDAEGNETKAGVYDGPHVMCRFISEEARKAADENILNPVLAAVDQGQDPPVELTVGLAVREDPGTIQWA